MIYFPSWFEARVGPYSLDDGGPIGDGVELGIVVVVLGDQFAFYL